MDILTIEHLFKQTIQRMFDSVKGEGKKRVEKAKTRLFPESLPYRLPEGSGGPLRPLFDCGILVTT